MVDDFATATSSASRVAAASPPAGGVKGVRDRGAGRRWTLKPRTAAWLLQQARAEASGCDRE